MRAYPRRLARIGLALHLSRKALHARALCAASPRECWYLSGPWHGEADALLESQSNAGGVGAISSGRTGSRGRERGLGPQSVAVHLEIDTGMARQGVPPHLSTSTNDAHELKNLLARFHPGSPLRLEGVMTHFSAADALDSDSFQQQLHGCRWRWIDLAAERLQLQMVACGRLRHAAGRKRFGAHAGAGKKARSATYVRPGLALYGYAPRFAPQGTAADEAAKILKPVLAWKTRVFQRD